MSLPLATTTSADNDATLGIGGKLAAHVACTGEKDAKITVHHVLSNTRMAETFIPGDQLQRALHVSHHNIAYPHSMSIETHSASGGVVGVTVHSAGDTETSMPTLARTCVATSGGGLAAVLHAAMPNTTSASRDMRFQSLKTDVHGYQPPDDVADDARARDKLNAVLYAGARGPPSEADMYRHTTKSRNGTDERVAIPIKDSPGAGDGTLTHVVSRCYAAKKAMSTIGGPESKVVDMPHRDTGEITKHLVVPAAKAAEMASIVAANTKVAGTFANGIIIRSHGDIDAHAKAGDSCVHTITFHRTPLKDGQITYKSELAGAAGASVTLPGTVSANEDAVHKAMWGKSATAGTTLLDGPTNVDGAGGEAADPTEDA